MINKARETKNKRPSLRLDAAPVRDPIRSAKASGLRYIIDTVAGFRRQRIGKGFRYVDPSGKPLRNREDLRRIKSLVIPPAWENVWISPRADSHLQATGRDAKGRKQYRYHLRWREVRDQTKYDRLVAFGRVLPQVRARVDKDLARPNLPRVKVIATIVKLLETTLIRVGNEEYARQNGSFGLTTMRCRHVKVVGAKIHFAFRGKSGVRFELALHDRRLAKIVRRCQHLPGQELFQYIDDNGERKSIDSSDVNEYLRRITAMNFTAKDFRTWAGTVLAAMTLQGVEQFDSKTQAKRHIVSAIETVAKKLGNTRAVCRKSYIHPAVLNSYLDGSLVLILERHIEKNTAGSVDELRPEEAAILAFLEQQLKIEGPRQAA